MKKLITIILLGIAITGMGQTIPKQILDTDVYSECITIDDILQYGKECWNDSTEVLFGYFKDYRTDVEFKTIYDPDPDIFHTNLIRTEKGFTHREPTFKGFLKWIKDK